MASTNTESVNKAARYFHDTHARPCPPSESPSAELFREVIDEIAESLKDRALISRVEYVGSTWEGTSIEGKSDYDVLLVINDPTIQLNARQTPTDEFRYLFKDHELFDARLKHSQMKSTIHKITNDFKQKRYTIDVGQQGLAITINIYNGDDSTPIPVDLVPAVELTGDEQFIYPSRERVPDKSATYWKKSFSLAAKKKLVDADSGDGVRREVLRVCKVIVKREDALAAITSYQLKSALFQQMDALPGSLAWRRERLGDRTLEVLQVVRDHYRMRTFPDYYIPSRDLIQGTSAIAAQNVASRLDNLIARPDILFKL